jgi:hypothetical protein
MRCPRSWYLQFAKRVDRIVPSYVTAGSGLDLCVQKYLSTGEEAQPNTPDAAELAVLKAELPAPGSVIVQQKFSLPCPGLEDSVDIMTGGLDYMTPPNLDLMVIGDLKRIWHQSAAMSAAELADDVQSNWYNWLVWRVYNPAEIIDRWTYCVRETRNAAGKVTRKPKAFSVDSKADRQKTDDWFERVVLHSARQMLELMRASAAVDVEHDPSSCEEGARCFVRHHCSLYQGPIKGESEIMVDLSRFRTNKTPSLASAVAEQRARIAINPPALTLAARAESEETGAVSVAELAAYVATLPQPEPLSVTTIEGPGAALLGIVEEDPRDAHVNASIDQRDAERPTEPAPPPEASTEAPKRKRRAARAVGPALASVVSVTDLSIISTGADTAEVSPAPAPEKQATAFEQLCAEVGDAADDTGVLAVSGLSQHERECMLDRISVEAATTEALCWELRDRGYHIKLTMRAL